MWKRKRHFKKVICVLIICATACLGFYVSAEEGNGDSIEIVSVTPNYYDNYTDPVTFTATIEYTLQSAEQGVIYLGFNIDKPECYTYSTELDDVKIVSRGTGTVVLSGTVTPVNWGSSINLMYQFMGGGNGAVKDFKIYAMLCSYPHEEPPIPLADHAAIPMDLPDTALQTEIFYGNTDNRSREVFDCSLESIIGEQKSDQYNPQLAHMLIALCNSVHDGKNMNDTYERMGFYNTCTDYSMSGIFLAYSMGKKKVEDETYVLVVARGTGDFSWSPSENYKTLSEWASNLLDAEANQMGQHSGFSDAALELHKRMINFLGEEDISGLSNVKFILTGHSRGAAAANILAAKMVDEGVKQENIYCYTFACPDTVVISKDKAEEYKCIYNIGNANDMVTWVPGAIWTNSEEENSYWNKYGNSLWYCEDWEDYRNLHEKITVVPSLMGEWIKEYHLQGKYLDHLREEKEENEYKEREETTKAIEAAAELQKEKARENWKEIREHIPSENTSIISINVFCPVDVLITDSEGILLASTTGTERKVYEGAEENILVSLCGDKKKLFIIGKDEFDISLVGTGTGEMEFSILCEDIMEENISEKNYGAVKLYDGKIMKCRIDSDAAMEEVKLFLVDDEENKIAEIRTDGTEELLQEKESETESVVKPKVESEDVRESTYMPHESIGKTEGEVTETEKVNMEDDSARVLYCIIVLESAVILFMVVVVLYMIKHKRKIVKL